MKPDNHTFNTLVDALCMKARVKEAKSVLGTMMKKVWNQTLLHTVF